MPTFASVLSTSNDKLRPNVVVDIGGVKYARFQPDSGLVVATDKRIVDKVSLNPTQVDLKSANTTIDNATVWFIDKDSVFTLAMGADASSLIGKDIAIYLGFVGVSMAFADYLALATYRIKQIDKVPTLDLYKVKCVTETDRMQIPIYQRRGVTNTTLTDSATTIAIAMESAPPETTGHLKIEDEIVSFTGNSFLSGVATFTGCARGIEDSTAVAHPAQAETFLLRKVETNPITLLLQLMISPGGGGTYDVLYDGCGIDQTLIDVAKFEQIRTDFFTGETFKLFLYDIDNALKWIQENLLLTCNVRLITDVENGKISLAILDQADLSGTVEELTDSSIEPHPEWKITQNGLVNRVRVQFDWSEGTQAFKKTSTHNDADSQSTFGIVTGSDIKIKGAVTAFSGSTIATDRAERFLGRFSTPRVEIETTDFLKHALVNVGDKVRLTTMQLPGEGGGLGLSSVVEVLEKALNFDAGDVRTKLVFTSYSNLRVGLISASPPVSSIVDQKTFSVTDGTAFEVGYKVRLFNKTTRVYTADAVNEVASISGNQLVMTADFTTTLSATDHELHFAAYDEVSETQQVKYAFIAPDTNVFVSDSKKAYQIIL